MTVNQKLSNRAQNLLFEVKGRVSTTSMDTLQEHPVWEFEYSGDGSLFQTDQILSLRKVIVKKDELESLFQEVFNRLFRLKTIVSLFNFQFREAENYLRDSNHLPAFSEEILESARLAFEKVKQELLVDLLFCVARKSKFIPWSDLTFVDKNRVLLDLFSQLGKHFSKEKSLELILAEGQTIWVRKNEIPLEFDTLENFLNRIFQTDSGGSALKVIGTL